ncbi:hypothetical protein [Maribacter cobaltidurans]|uniref:Uncharacterized protein n=1 Tax=Maribacter cobaltidurans TaxID=1178778 RepID=A0A223V0T1_9FLAO|nr:hypothetical protein [Maribacter cobaltidurans]ASV28906.1 hypothetical protein CJ263_00905 [Maribacter cobaltidurans]GGD73803.1 hypothetical protein GCM10011412_09350 [Maribacter cobaltidurans]
MHRILVLVLLTIVSCARRVSSEDFNHLNGYWEIEEVQFPNGNKKDYPVNTVVDYIKLENLEGFRKKMVPRFDGTFETSDDAEPFSIIEKNGVFYMRYQNPLSEWEETLLSLSKDKFSVKNPEGIIYHFKRFEPLNIAL